MRVVILVSQWFQTFCDGFAGLIVSCIEESVFREPPGLLWIFYFRWWLYIVPQEIVNRLGVSLLLLFYLSCHLSIWSECNFSTVNDGMVGCRFWLPLTGKPVGYLEVIWKRCFWQSSPLLSWFDSQNFVFRGSIWPYRKLILLVVNTRSVLDENSNPNSTWSAGIQV